MNNMNYFNQNNNNNNNKNQMQMNGNKDDNNNDYNMNGNNNNNDKDMNKDKDKSNNNDMTDISIAKLFGQLNLGVYAQIVSIHSNADNNTNTINDLNIDIED